MKKLQPFSKANLMKIKLTWILGGCVFIALLSYLISKPQNNAKNAYDEKNWKEHNLASQSTARKASSAGSARASNADDYTYTRKTIDLSLQYSCHIDSGNSFTAETFKQSGLDKGKWQEATSILRDALEESRKLVVANTTLIGKNEDEVEFLVGKSSEEGEAIVREFYYKMRSISDHETANFLASILDSSIVNFNHGRMDGKIVAKLQDGMFGNKKIYRYEVSFFDPQNGKVMRIEKISNDSFVSSYGREMSDFLSSSAK